MILFAVFAGEKSAAGQHGFRRFDHGYGKGRRLPAIRLAAQRSTAGAAGGNLTSDASIFCGLDFDLCHCIRGAVHGRIGNVLRGKLDFSDFSHCQLRRWGGTQPNAPGFLKLQMKNQPKRNEKKHKPTKNRLLFHFLRS